MGGYFQGLTGLDLINMNYYGFLGLISLLFSVLSFNETQPPSKEESMKAGKDTYKKLCAYCHQENGQGVKGLYPPLAKADYLFNDIDRGIHIIKYGKEGAIKVNGEEYNGYMSELGLSDEEVRDVTNYILNTWGNEHEMISLEKVQSIKR
ncbi:cytochrome c [Sediminitomix flava]|uniref:Cytochrome c n=2 Tax=Sediminitomix flava TaxID=379075 RepID=A0A315Z0R7_SEDFL|nr:cytochrome c [Sediminitomix flava]